VEGSNVRDAFVVAPSGLAAELFERGRWHNGTSQFEPTTSIVRGAGTQYVDVSEDQGLAQYYVDEPESVAIRPCGDTPTFFHVRFRDPLAAAAVIAEIFRESASVVVDNDHGLFMRMDRFATLSRKHPDWDWSTAESEPA